MKYTLSNTINRPLHKVMEKFKEPEGVKHWMEGLERIDHLSGTPGEVGAKTDFYFHYKGREMKITETILEQNLPHQIKFAYQSPMGYNEVEMRFESLSPDATKQTTNSYFALKGIMRIMGFVMKGLFKKQTMTYMTGFKRYVEQSA
jgi:hypothetical protein